MRIKKKVKNHSWNLQSHVKYIEYLLGSIEILDLKKKVNVAFWLFSIR